jgi:hypothetical protein
MTFLKAYSYSNEFSTEADCWAFIDRSISHVTLRVSKGRRQNCQKRIFKFGVVKFSDGEGRVGLPIKSRHLGFFEWASYNYAP